MKSLKLVVFLLFPFCLLGQVVKSEGAAHDSSIKRYVIGDRIISCGDCSIDFCGNVVNSKGVTLAKNARLFGSNSTPLFFTTDNIILSSIAANALRKKIRCDL
jgi:hypothetical protein